MEKNLQIGEMGVRLNRSPHTIRRWEREGKLPDHLLPERDRKNRRVWDAEQVELMREWMIVEEMRPGRLFVRQTAGWSMNGRGVKP